MRRYETILRATDCPTEHYLGLIDFRGAQDILDSLNDFKYVMYSKPSIEFDNATERIYRFNNQDELERALELVRVIVLSRCV